jgi:hypothetical protein
LDISASRIAATWLSDHTAFIRACISKTSTMDDDNPLDCDLLAVDEAS